MSALTGKRNIADEFTGSNPPETLSFFKGLHEKNVGFDWPVRQLCWIQKSKQSQGSGIIGFQWKPFKEFFHHEHATKGLEAIAHQSNPKIKIVFLTRNPIDIMLSNLKHEQSNHTIGAHCDVGDKDCTKKHSEIFSQKINLPTGNDLLQRLRKHVARDDAVKKKLESFNLTYVHARYEALYNSSSNNTNEWMKIFEYLGIGPATGLTYETVIKSFGYAATTTHKPASDKIGNFELVLSAVKGTEFEKYLLQ
jgi:hypothetical protein